MKFLPDVALAVLVVATLAANRLFRRSDRGGPLVTLLFVLAAVATFYPNEGGILAYSLARLDIRDGLFLTAGLLAAVAVVSGGRRMARSPSTWAGLVFLGLIGLSLAANWLLEDLSPVRALRDLRPLLFACLALVLPVLLGSRRQLDAFLSLLGTYAILVLSLTPVQIILASRSVIFLPGFQATENPTLIGWSWAGLSLAHAFVFVGLYRLMMSAGTRRRWLHLSLVTAGLGIVTVGLARMNWMALTVGFLIVLLVTPFQVKWRLTTTLSLVTVTVSLLGAVVLVASPGAGGRAWERMGFLFSTMLDPDQYKSSEETGQRTSIGRRLMENSVAEGVLWANPWLGAGLGYRYWAQGIALYTPEGDPVSLRGIQVRGGAYIHNSWLWLASKAGIPAAVAFGVFAALPLLIGLRRLPSLPRVADQAIVFGFSLRGIVLLLESIGHPYFFTVATATGLGLMVGVVVAVRSLSRNEVPHDARVDHRALLQRRAWHPAPVEPAAAGVAGPRVLA